MLCPPAKSGRNMRICMMSKDNVSIMSIYGCRLFERRFSDAHSCFRFVLGVCHLNVDISYF